ncbi:hypothetical protein STEG23_019428 [Scotinomys teguina]
MSVLRRLGVLRQPSLHLLTNKVWKKWPVMTLSSYFFEDEKEESSKPIGRYPIPYKKDLPFDIVELMEMEKTTGFLPNVFKVLSYRPLEFRAFFAYYNVIYIKKQYKLHTLLASTPPLNPTLSEQLLNGLGPWLVCTQQQQ